VEDIGANYAILVRSNNGKTRRKRIYLEELFESSGTNETVTAGDTIFVPRMEVFYVHGAVNEPGAYRLERDMTLARGLSVGGGLTEQGSLSRITITREMADGQLQDISLELTDRLNPDDVIYVKESIF
jgi:polysaccharide export outer membrane protein